MDLPEEAVARLNGLAQLNDGNLVLMVRDLVRSASALAPSCIGVIITIGDQSPLYAIDDRLRAGTAGVRASLRALITAPGPGHPARQVIFLAERPGEFEDFEVGPLSSPRASGRSVDHLVIDGDLDAATSLKDDARPIDLDPDRDLNRALGVLLDRGFPPAEARQELRDQADECGNDLVGQARVLLRSL